MDDLLVVQALPRPLGEGTRVPVALATMLLRPPWPPLLLPALGAVIRPALDLAVSLTWGMIMKVNTSVVVATVVSTLMATFIGPIYCCDERATRLCRLAVWC